MADIVNKNGTWTLQPDANFSNFDLDVIDLTDGTWNFVDTNSTVGSVAFADDANTLTANAISNGTVQQFGHSTAQNVGRWYRNLVDDDGVQLTTGDSFIFISTIQGLSSSNPSPYGFACGISVNPIGTGSNSNGDCLQGQGQKQGWMHHSLTNEQASSNTGRKHEYDSNIFSDGSTNVANLLTSSIATYMINFGNTNGKTAVAFNNIDNATNKNMQTLNNTTSSFFLQIGFGARVSSTSALAGAEHKQKIKFKVIRLSTT